MNKLVNGKRIALTVAETDQREVEEQQWLDDKPSRDDKRIDEQRLSEYPSASEQLGAIMDYLDTKDDTTEELKDIIKNIKDVKTKYPKKEK